MKSNTKLILTYTTALTVALSLNFFYANAEAPKNIIKPISNLEEFDKVIKSSEKKPVIIKFFSNTCPPCSALAPILKGIASEYSEKINFYSVNTSTPQGSLIADCHKIRTVPTLFFVKNEKISIVKDARTAVSLRDKIKNLFSI